MKYWLDVKYSLPSYTINPEISVISVGILSEEGKKYYGINWEYDFRESPTVIQDTIFPVLPFRPIDIDFKYKDNTPHTTDIKCWRTPQQLAKDIVKFFHSHTEDNPVEIWSLDNNYSYILINQICKRYDPDYKAKLPPYFKSMSELSNVLGKSLPLQITNPYHALETAEWLRYSYNMLTTTPEQWINKLKKLQGDLTSEE